MTANKIEQPLKYFAYGSNMSLARLRERVPSAVRLGVAKLEGHDLRFHKVSKDGSGKCDVFATHDDSLTYGVLFDINPTEKPSLDRAEGLGYGYEQKSVVVMTEWGEQVNAMTYYATKIDQSLQPYSWYLNHVLVGAQEAGLPDLYIQQLKNIKAIEDDNAERDRQQRAIHL